MNNEQQLHGTFQGQLTALAGWQARALTTKLAAGQPLGLGEQRLLRTARARASRAAGAERVQARVFV